MGFHLTLTTIPEMLPHEVWLVFSNEGPGVAGGEIIFQRPRGKSTDLIFSSAVSRAPKHLSCPLQNVLRSTEGRDSRKSHLGRFYKPYSHPTVIKMNKK